MRDELMALAEDWHTRPVGDMARMLTPMQAVMDARAQCANELRALATQQPEAGEAVVGYVDVGDLQGLTLGHYGKATIHGDRRENDVPLYAAPKAGAQDKLRAFAQDVMDCWPEGAPDGGDIQEFAERRGLIKSVEMPGPCGEGCGCSEVYTEDDAPFDCYRKTTLLTGKPESDAEIAALSAQRAEGKS